MSETVIVRPTSWTIDVPSQITVANLQYGCDGDDSTYMEMVADAPTTSKGYVNYHIPFPKRMSNITSVEWKIPHYAKLASSSYLPAGAYFAADSVSLSSSQIAAGRTSVGVTITNAEKIEQLVSASDVYITIDLASRRAMDNYLRIYDCYIKVNGDLPPASGKVKVNGSWVDAEPKVKVNGSWVEPDNIFVKVNGGWIEAG